MSNATLMPLSALASKSDEIRSAVAEIDDHLRAVHDLLARIDILAVEVATRRIVGASVTEYVTMTKAAELLGISRQTLYRMGDRVPRTQLGAVHKVPLSWVEAQLGGRAA